MKSRLKEEAPPILYGCGDVCDRHDTVTAPTYARVSLQNPSSSTPCMIMQVDDAPTQVKLGFYEELS